MFLKKEFTFYAAHRNQLLVDSKCSNIHGHQYVLTFHFDIDYDPRSGVGPLFEQFDKIENFLKEYIDHGMFIDTDDSAAPLLAEYTKPFYIHGTSSCENVAIVIANIVHKHLTPAQARFNYLNVQETKSSSIGISLDDLLAFGDFAEHLHPTTKYSNGREKSSTPLTF